MNDSIRTDNKFAAIPNWVIESGATPQAGWLYVWLKKYADYNTNDAFPSRKTLATKLGLAKAASVDRYIKELECLGALRVAPRWDEEKDGRQTSNLYTVVTVNPNVTPGTTPVPYRGQGVSPTGDRGGPVEGTLTKNQEIKIQKNEQRSEAAPDGFDEFWTIYPDKRNKKAAMTAYKKALKGTTPEALRGKLRDYLAARARHEKAGEFVPRVPYASTWLNGERWNDYEGAPAVTVRRKTNWADAL